MNAFTRLLQRVRPTRDQHAIALLHPGRVGSTVVGSMLGDRPDAVFDGEVFSPHRRGSVPELEQGLDAAEVIARRRGATPEQTYVLAVKYLWSQHLAVLDLDLGGLVDSLAAGGVEHFVVLHRRNYLRRIVSGAVGAARGSFHQRASEGPAALQRVTIDPADVPFNDGAPLFDVFDEMARGEAAITTALTGHHSLFLTYEDDIEDDPTVAYRRIVEFVGLPPMDIDVRLRRTNPFRLDEVVENYDELVEVLGHTEYAWMLERESQ